MSDDPTVTLEYHGPPQTVVELDREVRDGDELEVPASLASRLLCGSGFSGGPAEIQPPAELEPPRASGQTIAELEDEIARNAAAAEGAPAPAADETEVLPETDEDTGTGPLAGRTLDQLQALARQAGLEGYSELRKDDLIDALEDVL